MTTRKPSAVEMATLLGFHAVLSGAFIVAYLTGDEDTYGMHVFSGYAVLAAIVLRGAAGLPAPAGSPLRLPRPSVAALAAWGGRLFAGDPQARTGRSPLTAWMAAALLAGVGLAAGTGAVADVLIPVEHLHKELGEASLFLILAHIVLVFALHGLKRLPLGFASRWTAWRSAFSNRPSNRMIP
ncbi:hypothetical protein AZL_a02820 (plasmid) [Azospirillum sp. B510]|uniref:hypothetical protein n=1 Tax=Azospirillum sp. (strain B510) TaxID=137722 RepID=UPI0001C4BAAC|nr:hypothetical protein [Azospirillum sp. B510]BAI73813.1 hypothetical protein AZL_a02820 [Azospirillum sp. B510]